MGSRYLVFLFLLFGLIGSKPPASGQDLNYNHYNAESGLQLPSNEVYGILFDRNNVLWATTDRGIWRYDGYSARQFTVTDGLKENANFRIFLDYSGIIWVSSINNYLYGITGDSVWKHPMSDSIHNRGNSSGFIQQLTVRPDNSIYLSYNRPGLIRYKTGETPETITGHRKNHGEATVAIHYDGKEYYWDMIGLPDTSRNLRTVVKSENGWTYLTCGVTDSKNNFRKDLSPIGPDEFLFSYSNKVFHIKNGRLAGEKTLGNDVIDVYADEKGNFWIGLEKEGVLLFLNGDLNSAPLQYLKGESVSGITNDHEGSYWFSTTTNGIFRAITLDISVYQNFTSDIKDRVITAAVSDEENIYLGTATGLILKGTELNNQAYLFSPVNTPASGGSVRKLFVTPERHLIVMNSSLWEIDKHGHPTGIRTIPSYPYGYSTMPNGDWLASFTSEIQVVHKSQIIRKWNAETIRLAYPDQENLTSAIFRVRCLFLDSNNILWLGSQKSGLFSSRDNKIYFWGDKDSLFSKRTQDIVQAGENRWISIADHGIAVIFPDSSFVRITQKDGLSSDIIDVLFAENDSVVWAGTNNGLNRIVMASGRQTPSNILHYTMSQGLPSNRIYCIIKHKDNIWVGTSQGAVRLSPDLKRPMDYPLKLIFGPLVVNGRSIPLTDSIQLGPNDNNLEFSFKAITYRNPGSLRYRYRLAGADKEYILTNTPEPRYPDLQYGNYTFMVNASYGNEFDPASEKRFQIHIRKHWYETRLALGLYSVAFLVLIVLIFRLILLAVKSREFEKRRLLEAEKRSLLSQMNPHFIFNSLNSIQHYIVQNDQMQANNYLTDFSGLIRKILENSKRNLISLHEEIATLTLYLNMEKLRFEDNFEYEIIRDNGIDYHETMIPPMLIQPFVENAIWHGLMPLKSRGALGISFIFREDHYLCRIMDNGIGREKSRELKGRKEQHLSTGIQNIQERIQLINKLNKRKITLSITDVTGPDGTASGTLVELLLPFNLKV